MTYLCYNFLERVLILSGDIESTLHAICLRGVTCVHAKQLFGQTNQQSRTFNRFCIVCMQLYNGQTVLLGHL